MMTSPKTPSAKSFPCLRDDGKPKKSIIVLGLPRGGTSMIASVLQSLGYFMGETPDRGNLEDIDFRRTWEAGDDKQISDKVNGFDRNHKRWAIKVPSMWKDLKKLPTFFPGVSYIFVARDPIALAMRSISIGRSNESSTSAIVSRACQGYSSISLFLENEKRPSLFVSYDKAISDRTNFVEAVAGFTGVEDLSLRQNAIDRLTTDHKEYLKRTDERLKK